MNLRHLMFKKLIEHISNESIEPSDLKDKIIEIIEYMDRICDIYDMNEDDNLPKERDEIIKDLDSFPKTLVILYSGYVPSCYMRCEECPLKLNLDIHLYCVPIVLVEFLYTFLSESERQTFKSYSKFLLGSDIIDKFSDSYDYDEIDSIHKILEERYFEILMS